MRDPHGYFTLALTILAPLALAVIGGLHLARTLRAAFIKATSRSEALGLADID